MRTWRAAAALLLVIPLVADCSGDRPDRHVAALTSFVATWASPEGSAFQDRLSGTGDPLVTELGSLARQGVTAFAVRSAHSRGDRVEGVLELHFSDGAVLDSPMAAGFSGDRVLVAPALLNSTLRSWRPLLVEAFGSPAAGELFSRSGRPLTRQGRATRRDLDVAVDLMRRALGGRVTGQQGRVLLTGDDRRELARVDPADGQDTHTTLDDVLQEHASTVMRGKPGALVVLDPEDGGIRALVSNSDPARPGSPPAATAHLPGSTFKIVTSVAAARAGALKPDQLIDCPARLLIAGHTIHNYESKAAGRITIRRAFAMSCNTTFARIGAALGLDRLARAARDLGIDGKETAGSAPSRVLVPKSRAEVATLAIGASTVNVTPVAMAGVVATVAHGGIRVEPHWGAAPTPSERVFAASDASNLLGMMEEVVISGTGHLAALPGVRLAGKTGTAENLRPTGGVSSTDAWFVAIAPATPARLVAVCFLPGQGVGGEAAAPVVQDFLEAVRERWDPPRTRTNGP